MSKHYKHTLQFLAAFLAANVAIGVWIAAADLPRGLYYLPSAQTLNSAIVHHAFVDGVVIGSNWSDLEPSPGVYVFNTAASGQSLDSQIADAEAAGKQIKIQIQTGGPKVSDGGHKPNHLYTSIDADGYAGGKYFTYIDNGDTITIPVFWEPTLLARHAAVAQALANHLSGHPLVKAVLVPYCNSSSDDWDIKTSNSVDGLGSSQQSRWLTTLSGSGYATMEVALKAAGTATFTAYHTAFPTLFLINPIGRVNNATLNPGGAANFGRNIAEDVINTAAAAWPGLVAAQKQNLNGGGVPAAPGDTSAWNDLYRLAVPHGAQMVWAAYGDAGCAPDNYGASRMNAGTGSPCIDSSVALKQAIDLGCTYATAWQELYEDDLENLGSTNADPHPGSVSDLVAYAHARINNGPAAPASVVVVRK